MEKASSGSLFTVSPHSFHSITLKSFISKISALGAGKEGRKKTVQIQKIKGDNFPPFYTLSKDDKKI